RRPFDHRRFGQPSRRDGAGDVHSEARPMAGGRDWAKLLHWTEGGARNDRADDALFAQIDERDAERGLAANGGRPEYLSVLAGIYGAVRAAVPMGGREDCRRLLWHNPGSHQ